MPQADEYVETIVTDGFDRELEQEENIVRSLSFCATGSERVSRAGFTHVTGQAMRRRTFRLAKAGAESMRRNTPRSYSDLQR